MVPVGGTLTVIVCPSNILTRIWTSPLNAVDFAGEGLVRAEPELMLSSLLIFRVRRKMRLRRVARPVLRHSPTKVSGTFQRMSSMTPRDALLAVVCWCILCLWLQLQW